MAKPQAEARRFLFDHSFDAPKKSAKKPKPEEEKPPEPTFSREQLEEARQQGYQEGRFAGAEEMASGAEAELARLVAEIAGRLPALDAAQADAHRRLMRDGTAVAAAIMRKILPSFVERNGLDELDALLGQCLRTLIDQPKIAVRVSALHADAVSTRLAAAAAAGRFDGRFMVEADDAMGPSDCQVTWQSGGLERNADDIWRQVEAALERYLAAPSPDGDGADTARDSDGDGDGAAADQADTPDAQAAPAEALDTSEER